MFVRGGQERGGFVLSSTLLGSAARVCRLANGVNGLLRGGEAELSFFQTMGKGLSDVESGACNLDGGGSMHGAGSAPLPS